MEIRNAIDRILPILLHSCTTASAPIMYRSLGRRALSLEGPFNSTDTGRCDFHSTLAGVGNAMLSQTSTPVHGDGGSSDLKAASTFTQLFLSKLALGEATAC